MKTIGIIPARYASIRLPGKPLLDLAGKSMIHRVYDRVSLAGFDAVVVATDHPEIAAAVQQFGGRVQLTRSDHPSGTDRIAEALDQLLRKGEHYDIIINVQGDEPFVEVSNLTSLVEVFNERPEAGIATLVTPMDPSGDIHNPNQVKVVFDRNGKALYFSRHAIPFLRGKDPKEWSGARTYFRHLGVYAFRSEVLQRIVKYPVSGLEQAESLEQLRWMEEGESIYVRQVEDTGIGIDTPEDLERARAILKNRS